jgi:RND family efflux transporter MFP subunit
MKTLLIVGMSLGLLTGAGFGLASRGTESAREELQPPARRESVTANGFTEGARRELAFRPEVAGTLRTIAVSVNQDVHKGKLLVELENASHQAKVQQAEASVKSREAEHDRARDAFERARRGGTGVVSPQDLKQVEMAQVRAKADWDFARAEWRLAQAELAKTRLAAPWDGRVLEIYDEPGAQVGPASRQPVLILADVSRRRVRAFVEELDALRVKEGQRVVVTVDSLPGKDFTGKVSAAVLLRMDQAAPHSDAPGEYLDIYHRPVLIDLDDGTELPLNLRVKVTIYTP